MVPVRQGTVLLLLVCVASAGFAPPAQALYGFTIEVAAPEVAVVGGMTHVTGHYHSGAVPAPDRIVWLVHEGRRVAETRTALDGSFGFALAWPVAGWATFQVIADPFSILETRSDPFEVLGLDAPAAPPLDMDVVGVQWGRVDVRWDPGVAWPGSEREAWHVYRAPGTSADWRLLATLDPEADAFQDPVETGTWYTYAVRGWNRVGEGAPLERVVRTEGPNTTAASPETVSAAAGASWRRAVLSWPTPDEPLGEEAETFQVFRRPALTDAPWSLVGEVPRPATAFEDRVAVAGTYEYAVRGWNRHGAGPLTLTSFTFSLPPADWVGVKVEFVQVCTDGQNSGYQCRHVQNGGRLWTYDDARVVSMRPLVSFWLLDGFKGVPEAPVVLLSELEAVCYDDDCPSEGRTRTLDTGMDGEGLAAFSFGAFVDPEGGCVAVNARATGFYEGLTNTEGIFFEVCD